MADKEIINTADLGKYGLKHIQTILFYQSQVLRSLYFRIPQSQYINLLNKSSDWFPQALKEDREDKKQLKYLNEMD